ncbi:MAG: L-histidine N(alpha)-methyltransferase [Pseudomonadota bacterium]
MNTPRLIQVSHEDPAALRAEVLAGLAAEPAVLAPKFFYDGLGARLFSAITALPEYYPTRTEAAIFRDHLDAIAAAVGPAPTLVDLGAGNCEKAARLLEPLAVQRYVAVDIAAEYLLSALDRLQYEHPNRELLGIGLDFSRQLVLPDEVGPGPRLLFYPGSSIGNFDPGAALDFLRQVRAACAGGRLLIGVDLVKGVEVLEPAYDDALGVTAAFNRNLLLHLNRLIGADFALADWRHVAFYEGAASRIEMHLEAVRAVTVRWPDGERRFARGERIHTERSYKWRLDDFADLLRAAGFKQPRAWRDAQDWFAVFAADA